MIDNLINKLRAVDHLSLEDCFCQSSLYDKAANRIEQLTGEVQRWQGMFDEKHNLMLEHKVRAKTAEAERDRLREALDGLLTSVEHADFADGWCCCGDDMLHHQSPMDCGHTPVDMGEYHAFFAIKEARAALKKETT